MESEMFKKCFEAGVKAMTDKNNSFIYIPDQEQKTDEPQQEIHWRIEETEPIIHPDVIKNLLDQLKEQEG